MKKTIIITDFGDSSVGAASKQFKFTFETDSDIADREFVINLCEWLEVMHDSGTKVVAREESQIKEIFNDIFGGENEND